MDNNIDMLENLKATAIALGDEPLLVSPEGQVINLAKGYIPLHVNFTVEDKAAKGLRKGKADDTIEPPVYFSAVEIVCSHHILLLTGPSGSGKTTFAKHLAYSLAAGTGPGHLLDSTPRYYAVDGPEAFQTLNSSIPKLVEECQAINSNSLIIIDAVEKLGDEGPALLAELLAFVKCLEKVKLLILGDSSNVKQWFLSSDIIRHDIRPLSEIQRRQAVSLLTGLAPSKVHAGLGRAAANPAYFALALEANHSGDESEGLVDAWLAVVAPEKDQSEKLTAQAFESLDRDSVPIVSSLQLKSPSLLACNAVQQLLAARHLVNLPLETAIELFHREPLVSEPVIRSLIRRLGNTKRLLLLRELLCGSRSQMQLGALLVSDFVLEHGELQEQITSQMLAIVKEGTLPAIQRVKAGRVLARLGDPRDLTGLAKIPAGDFILGSEDHPNSRPPAMISGENFEIGLYPVVNREYSLFVKETGRDWQSPDGFELEMSNAPATDLTWYDAMAYCEWLTALWQSSGKISKDELVRLPSEPEWERAARGDQQTTLNGEPIYPWGTGWKHDAANDEEAGFNTRLPVGLFPKGRSPYGCHDMVGQVWEWCTTLWGEDMTTPSFQYPYRDDGREDLQASGSIRRVLRGGCFSSGRLKATCTYRGSLEPAGFWRGNGFRIVVALIRS